MGASAEELSESELIMLTEGRYKPCYNKTLVVNLKGLLFTA